MVSREERKANLKAKVAALRAELNKLEAEEHTEHMKHMVGKCFTVQNNRSGVSWPLYMRVLELGDQSLITMFFEQQDDGRLVCDPQHEVHNTAYFNDHTEISEADFEKAWNDFKLTVCNTKVKP